MKKNTALKKYKQTVRQRLRRITPVFARASIGDFSRNIEIPNKEDEFTELFMGLQIMLEVIRSQLAALRDANEALQKMNRSQTEFTSMVSHELRTPLNAVKEGIDIVLEGIDGPLTDPQKETLGIAKNNVDRLNRMINNVLYYTRFEYGKLDLSLEKTDLKKLLEEIHHFMLPTVTKKKISFFLKAPLRALVVRCDPDKIRQVVINLIDNAMKFTQTGGKITITLFSSKKDTSIQVRDTGSGIKKEDQKKIFQIFDQGKSLGMTRTGGSGVGLAVCKLLMEHHKGKIRLWSQPNRGTTFTVRWPKTL